MPDFNIENYDHCLSAENWETQVASSKTGATYTVRWDNHSHKNRNVQRDWSCNCMSYSTRPGYCKHIEQIRSMSLQDGGRCGWMAFLDGGEAIDSKCPRCSGDVTSTGWAV